ncbi:MAG TPA: hypothetical protein VGF40_07405 [Thermoanaerobaculia bacterium]
MSHIPIHTLADDARVWVFGANAPLTDAQKRAARETIAAYLVDWNSHGDDIPAAVDVLGDRFVVVAADRRAVSGGCSVDRMYRQIRALKESVGADLLDTTLVFWRENGSVRSASRAEFRRLAEAGEVDAATVVVDTTAETLGAIRSGAWEKPAAAAWHADAFPLRKVN